MAYYWDNKHRRFIQKCNCLLLYSDMHLIINNKYTNCWESKSFTAGLNLHIESKICKQQCVAINCTSIISRADVKVDIFFMPRLTSKSSTSPCCKYSCLRHLCWHRPEMWSESWVIKGKNRNMFKTTTSKRLTWSTLDPVHGADQRVWNVKALKVQLNSSLIMLQLRSYE